MRESPGSTPTLQQLAAARERNIAGARRLADAILDEGLAESARDPRVKESKRALWDKLRAEAEFIDPDLDTLDYFYETATILILCEALEPCRAADVLHRFAVSLGLANPEQEVRWTIATARNSA